MVADKIDLAGFRALGFGLRRLSETPTRDGGAFYAELTHNGVPVAIIGNEGRGGPTDVTWGVVGRQPCRLDGFVNYSGKFVIAGEAELSKRRKSNLRKKGEVVLAAKAASDAFIAAHAPVLWNLPGVHASDTFQVTEEHLFDTLIEDGLMRKSWQGKLRRGTHTYVWTSTMERGKHYRCTGAPTPDHKARLRKWIIAKHGGEVFFADEEYGAVD